MALRTDLTPATLPKLMTTEEVAAVLKVSVRAVQRWAREAGLPATKLGSVLRFEEADVVRWYAQQKEGTC